LGARPVTLALTRTLAPTCTKLTLPRTVLPLVGWSSAAAFGPSGDMLWQAPSNTAVVMPTAILIEFIEVRTPSYWLPSPNETLLLLLAGCAGGSGLDGLGLDDALALLVVGYRLVLGLGE